MRQEQPSTDPTTAACRSRNLHGAAAFARPELTLQNLQHRVTEPGVAARRSAPYTVAMATLQGKTAVITGGSTGIGLAIAKRFVAEGAYVFITGRTQHELDKARAQIGRNVTAIRSDVTDPADLDRAFGVPRLNVQREVDDGRLVHVLPSYVWPNAGLFLLHRGGAFVAPKIRAFIDYMRTALSPSATTGRRRAL